MVWEGKKFNAGVSRYKFFWQQKSMFELLDLSKATCLSSNFSEFLIGCTKQQNLQEAQEYQ